MKRYILYLVLVLLTAPATSCKSTGGTTTVVKPKYHHRWYSRKKDKRTKRVKVVKMKT